jgi:hypothetical protein
MQEKGIFRTGSLNPDVAKPSGRWSIDPGGQMVYGGDHSLTHRRTKEVLAMAHEILKKMGARKITSKDVPVNLNPRTRGHHRCHRRPPGDRGGLCRTTDCGTPFQGLVSAFSKQVSPFAQDS